MVEKEEILEEMFNKVNEMVNVLEECELRDPDFSMAHETAETLREELRTLLNNF